VIRLLPSPLGDFYKTQVRQLAQTMNIPDTIIRSRPPPTCGKARPTKANWLTYEEADKLLYLLVDERYTSTECIASGYAEAFVNTVVERVRRNQSSASCRPSQAQQTAPWNTTSYTCATGYIEP